MTEDNILYKSERKRKVYSALYPQHHINDAYYGFFEIIDLYEKLRSIHVMETPANDLLASAKRLMPFKDFISRYQDEIRQHLELLINECSK